MNQVQGFIHLSTCMRVCRVQPWRQHLELVRRACRQIDTQDKWSIYLRDHGKDFLLTQSFQMARYFKLLCYDQDLRPFLLHRCGGSWITTHYEVDHHTWHQYDSRLCYHCHTLPHNGIDCLDTNAHSVFECPKFDTTCAKFKEAFVELAQTMNWKPNAPDP